MAASREVLTTDNRPKNDDWTVVVIPRRGKQRRNLFKTRIPEAQHRWTPTDLETDPDRQSKLMRKMDITLKRIESSQFYQTFLDQIQTPQLLNHFHKVLGSDSNLQMVIYGIGSIELYETPRLQLSLAILIKRKFDWIGDIEVFDPVLSATESLVLEAFGCTVLSVNEQGRRQAIRPTMFFMPHCEAELYDNLLQANWKKDFLNKIVLFGNSFEMYEQHVSDYRSSSIVGSTRHIVALGRLRDEMKIEIVSDEYFAAFHDSSWHFFSSELETDLLPLVSC